MAVRRLTATGDWTFGHGRNDYLTRSKEIEQNVVTRLKSFKNDWFADIEAGVDWDRLFSERGNQDAIRRAVERTVLKTTGVRSIQRLRVVEIDRDRRATIEVRYVDIFDESIEVEV
jgi:hypothetical protein